MQGEKVRFFSAITREAHTYENASCQTLGCLQLALYLQAKHSKMECHKKIHTLKFQCPNCQFLSSKSYNIWMLFRVFGVLIDNVLPCLFSFLISIECKKLLIKMQGKSYFEIDQAKKWITYPPTTLNTHLSFLLSACLLHFYPRCSFSS